jgi:ABC-type multidrug transport system fused ATPase/permease subunit
MMKKVAEGKASSRDLFKMIDMAGNGNGTVDKQEYGVLATRLGNQLSEHRITEIFAEVKKKSGSTTLELDEDEFTEALKYLQDKNIMMTLEAMGISMSTLVGLLTMLVILLVLLFAFIFVGIEAFAIGGSFGAVINSVIPAGNIDSLTCVTFS